MRAGRLLNLLLILQNRGRTTAAELAKTLEVSERTVFRDIEALGSAGVPVYAIRGPDGGFELLETFHQAVPPLPPGLTPTRGPLRRVRVLISPAALQRAVVLNQPEGWRQRPSFEPPTDRPDWIEGSFRFDSYDEAIMQLLALGLEVEVLLPLELRRAMADVAGQIATTHEATT